MAKVKNQHYVPRLYLQKFANSKGMVWTYDKQTSNSYLASISGIANENFFYDNNENNKNDSQVIEKNLSDFEGQFSPFFNSFLEGLQNNTVKCLTTDIRKRLCEFMVIQILRTKETREDILQSQKLLRQSIIDKGWFTDEQLESYHLNNLSLGQTSTDTNILSSENIRTLLFEMLVQHIWIVFENKTTIPFYSSDHPIVRKENVFDQYKSNYGFGSPGIEIAFPLSPNFNLVLAERTHFESIEQCDNQVLTLGDTQNIIYYNSLQVLHSYRQIFCNENSFKHASQLIALNPHYADPNRHRSIIN